MADPQVVIEWFKKADEDLEFAASVINESPFFAQICFHFHQAAEKHLKSFIIARDLEFKKIHDLPVLLKLCLTSQPGLQEIMDDCKFLNRFYIDTRYPVHWPSNYKKEEALNAKKAAENIRSKIVSVLKTHIPSIE
jgi:HEPN domain-containing protein